ncbi:GAF domain-containing protein [Flavobacterium sp.]|uniref:GAF domain-containing protein n=1 Tax=Flavobacterium sp. TaxID=239 RepID=UPI0028BF4B37|nr:GAF domain-containing protein [Flavobacterium sp.]
MNFNEFKHSPFEIKISFHKVLETLEDIAASNIDYRSNYAKALIEKTSEISNIRNGFENMDQINENETLIQHLLADLFPTALTHNEIKAVTIPFLNITFNYTERFKKILADAGSEFDISIRDFDKDQFYVMNCCLILNAHYNQKFDFSKPLYYDIPDSEGITRHYRILYNADFLEIIPTEKSVTITQKDIEILIDNFENVELWKEKFPPQSWLLKGFGIVVLYDATTENAISNLKTGLNKLNDEETKPNIDNFSKIFQSIFRISNIKIGFTSLLGKEIIPNERRINSFILGNRSEIMCKTILPVSIYDTLINQQKKVEISNVERLKQNIEYQSFANHLLEQNIHSCILAPVVKENKLFGILEIVTSKKNELNSLNSNRLDIIMPFIADTIDRYNASVLNKIEAIIQKEYTKIHSSVYWKFQDNVLNYIISSDHKSDYEFSDIVFKDVYPLYGQIDIKESSGTRNYAVQHDIQNQLNDLINIISLLHQKSNLKILEQRKFELESYLKELQTNLKADTEQQINRYVETEIHPILQNAINSATGNSENIQEYFEKIDDTTGTYYNERKKFDATLTTINKKLSVVLDDKQKEAQAIFPHYFERFNTDGVEHNMYIGNSIAPQSNFSLTYLYNMRLWQLQVLAEMEREHYALKDSLPYPLEVTSLILVFSSPITIRFRMDEKRFDVDGSYNARYEVVKKRIDKAMEKGTQKRITEQGKITIVYSHADEEKEYKKYIEYLQFQKILEPTTEFLEVEDLQGVSGLKAIRVKVKLN